MFWEARAAWAFLFKTGRMLLGADLGYLGYNQSFLEWEWAFLEGSFGAPVGAFGGWALFELNLNGSFLR